MVAVDSGGLDDGIPSPNGGAFPPGGHLATCAATGAVYSAWVAGWEKVLNPWSETPSAAYLLRWFDNLCNGLLSYVILYSP